MNRSKSQFVPFSLDTFVERTRALAAKQSSHASVKGGQSLFDIDQAMLGMMKETFADHQTIAEQVPEFSDDDVVLFEDDSVSIWFCRFQPGVLVPPHDHQMSAFIGVYAGVENNGFYAAQADGLCKVDEKILHAGNVLAIDSQAIHSVSCPGPDPSCALHVYLGKLTEVQRSLFDWDSGEQIPFTDENYQNLTKTETDLRV